MSEETDRYLEDTLGYLTKKDASGESLYSHLSDMIVRLLEIQEGQDPDSNAAPPSFEAVSRDIKESHCDQPVQDELKSQFDISPEQYIRGQIDISPEQVPQYT
ncbi:hypothetical protein KIPB_002706 [Kipferlia bialata]|uniref:Uncharacterized protein n=1 Tax=Kipferlia bialata TaxID=797122 RepID=A0A391NJL0_9EUKA|nr:hypothetical protein KIPB_002706 [Kipferlia bialata]|eukprot:g2706.t1